MFIPLLLEPTRRGRNRKHRADLCKGQALKSLSLNASHRNQHWPCTSCGRASKIAFCMSCFKPSRSMKIFSSLHALMTIITMICITAHVFILPFHHSPAIMLHHAMLASLLLGLRKWHASRQGQWLRGCRKRMTRNVTRGASFVTPSQTLLNNVAHLMFAITSTWVQDKIKIL